MTSVDAVMLSRVPTIFWNERVSNLYLNLTVTCCLDPNLCCSLKSTFS